jgi:hypothetical protein
VFTSIIKVENNRVAKFKEFNEAQDAQAHCEVHGGFVYDGSYSPELWVDGEAVTAVPLESSEEVKARVWESIKSERDKRKASGVKVTVSGVDKWFHSDDASRIQQIGLVMMGANIPNGLQWKTTDGTFVTMTQALAMQIFEASAEHDVAVFGIAEQHRANMEASESPDDYDYSTGWPQTFAEWQAEQ